MSWDFLNSESEEVKKVFSQISETEKALRKALDNYRPSVMKERYLTGEEVCAYLHISPRTLQHTADPFHRYRRTQHHLSRIRHPRNPPRQYAAHGRAVLMRKEEADAED